MSEFGKNNRGENDPLILALDISLAASKRDEMARRIILALRTRLRDLDPTLPNVYDGTSWMEFEQRWSPAS